MPDLFFGVFLIISDHSDQFILSLGFLPDLGKETTVQCTLYLGTIVCTDGLGTCSCFEIVSSDIAHVNVWLSIQSSIHCPIVIYVAQSNGCTQIDAIYMGTENAPPVVNHNY